MHSTATYTIEALKKCTLLLQVYGLNVYTMQPTRYLLFLLLWGITTGVSAQVYINEFSASNLNGFLDSYQKTEDWIELYNAGTSAVDISGWHLSDKESKPEKWEIPAGTMIDPGGYLVFLCSGRDQVVNGNEYHTNFKFTQTKDNEVVLLSDPGGNVQEMHPLGLTLVEHSHCRVTDGSAEWAICTAPSLGESNDGTVQVGGYTQAPSMDMTAGFYESEVTVAIANNEPNSVLRYTLDGTNPTASSDESTEPLTITSTTVVKAQAFSNDENILPGKMDFNTYFIDEDYSLAVFSVAADQVIDLANGMGELIPIGSLEYFNVDKEREATAFGSLNRHGQDSWVLDHRSLDWVSRDEMGYSKAVEAPLFSFSDRDEYQKFMFRNSGDDNYPAINDGFHDGSTHIRDEYVQTLAQEGGMKLDVRAVERVILFLNGEYWGVYGMRDRPVDHDYTKEYYDQGKYEIQYLTTWETTEIEYGGQKALNEWVSLRDFILESDMSIEENYELAADSLNMLSLIDYMVANLNVVASDWLNYNTGWWRGLNPEGDHKKWGYILWDLDATFDYYINYSGVPNISPSAMPCDLEEISEFMDDFFFEDQESIDPTECPSVMNGEVPYPPTDVALVQVLSDIPECCDEWSEDCQFFYDFYNADGGIPGNVGKHEKIFLKLLEENPTFRQLYYSRYADLMNTVYTCENMNETLTRMLAVIEPEMPGQIARWGGSMTEWRDNVDQLRDFIDQRCELLGGGMLDCYEELSGPYQLTLMTEPDGIGEIDINTLDIEAFPWTGEYFGGMENLIKAKVFDDYEDDYVFSHWESRSGNTISPNVTSRRAEYFLESTDTLVAVFSTVTAVEDLAVKYDVEVYPNPTKGACNLSYTLSESAEVSVALYDALGRKVMDLPEASGRRSAGTHQANLNFDNRQIANGLYFLDVTIDRNRRGFKLSIIR